MEIVHVMTIVNSAKLKIFNCKKKKKKKKKNRVFSLSLLLDSKVFICPSSLLHVLVLFRFFFIFMAYIVGQ